MYERKYNACTGIGYYYCPNGFSFPFIYGGRGNMQRYCLGNRDISILQNEKNRPYPEENKGIFKSLYRLRIIYLAGNAFDRQHNCRHARISANVALAVLSLLAHFVVYPQTALPNQHVDTIYGRLRHRLLCHFNPSRLSFGK